LEECPREGKGGGGIVGSVMLQDTLDPDIPAVMLGLEGDAPIRGDVLLLVQFGVNVDAPPNPLSEHISGGDLVDVVAVKSIR